CGFGQLQTLEAWVPAFSKMILSCHDSVIHWDGRDGAGRRAGRLQSEKIPVNVGLGRRDGKIPVPRGAGGESFGGGLVTLSTLNFLAAPKRSVGGLTTCRAIIR